MQPQDTTPPRIHKGGRARTGTTLECVVCRRPFYVPPSRMRRQIPKYCSMLCMGIAFCKPQRALVARICAACGTHFEAQAHFVRQGGGVYCSRACWRATRFQGETHYCEVCAKQFRVSPSKLKNPSRWCSVVCAGIARRDPDAAARQSWRYAQWRRAVFERDDYTCQRCRERGGVLHAHHQEPWARYPALRFEVSNGVTLCVRCHSQTHRFRVRRALRQLPLL